MMTGGCLCGAVKYRAGGKPLFALRCFCRDCQRSSGSTNVPIMAVSKALFKVTGETRAFAITGGSGRPAIRNFCPLCSSLLFGTPDIAPDIITLYAGTLDDPAHFKPDYLQFVRSRPDWEIGHGLPEFQTVPLRSPVIE